MTRRQSLTLTLSPSILVARPIKGARYRVLGASKDQAQEKNADKNGPVVIELIAEERWPIRALDPILQIGGLTLDSYQFGNAENTILRFSCYDPDKLQDGATMYVQYGQDASSRTDLPNFYRNTNGK